MISYKQNCSEKGIKFRQKCYFSLRFNKKQTDFTLLDIFCNVYLHSSSHVKVIVTNKVQYGF